MCSSDLFGKLQVLFKVAGVTHPGLPPKDESYVMCAGDRQDDIEVQKIDEQAAVITFNNHGVVQELPLVPSTGGGGAPAPAGGIPPPPMSMPGTAPDNGGAHFGFGGRFGRGRNVVSAGNPNADAPPSSGTTNPSATAPAQEPLSPEAQVIMIEANRMATQDAVNRGEMPPLPPTELTPPDATTAGGRPLVENPGASSPGGGPPSVP